MKLFLKSTLLIVAVFVVCQVYAQNPLSNNSLVAVKSDQVTDSQLREFVEKSKSSGLSDEQIERLALSKGLPSAEMAKLKDRIANLQPSGPTNQNPTPSETQVVEDTSLEDDATVITLKPKVDEAEDKGSAIEIYGHRFFKNNSFKTYEKGTDTKAPDDYVIGVGDEFAISVFGISYYNEVLKVDGNGYIRPSNMGSINITGMSYKKAKDLIRSKLSGYFDLSANQLNVSLTYSRIITINVVGEVDIPGSYKIPAINTAFNALIAVGGPSDLGSVRNIQVKRGGKAIKTLDVYEFLSNPNSKQDFFLQDNDYIMIQARTKTVSVKGEVRRPMYYELLDKENLQELITLSGGLTSKAYTKLLTVSRLSDDGRQREILNLSLDSLVQYKKTFKLKDGDEITIFSKQEELSQFVEIQGAVNMQGKFQWVEGDRISHLIHKANGLRFDANKTRAFIVRTKPDLNKEFISVDLSKVVDSFPDPGQDYLLQKGDIVTIGSNSVFVDEMTVNAIGLFRKPGPFPFVEGMSLSDLLFVAGGLKMEADVLRIEISRISFFSGDYKPGEDSRVVIKMMKVGNDFKLADDELNFKLNPYDQVFVRMVPDFELQQNLTLNGEVKYPGIYALASKEEHLSDLITRAGGLNRFAYPEAATLYRPSLPGGYIVMNLKDALNKKKSKFDYVLKEGDVVTIPKTIDFISIRGKVEYLDVVNQMQVNAPFESGKRANHYIKEYANGFTKESWKRKTYVVDNNAKVNRTQSFIGIKIYPKVKKGSTIYVVTKPEKAKKKKSDEPVNWNKAIEGFTIKLTGVLTLAILISTLAK